MLVTCYEETKSGGLVMSKTLIMISTLQHQRCANSMHIWQRRSPVLLEDVYAQAQDTTGQANASLQCDGHPSYTVQLQQLGSNNHSTPHARIILHRSYLRPTWPNWIISNERTLWHRTAVTAGIMPHLDFMVCYTRM